MAGPLIVTALLGSADQARFDRLRATHFPPERNQLDAHLTIFHAIPHMLEDELRHRLAGLAAEHAPPRATISGLMDLGEGSPTESSPTTSTRSAPTSPTPSAAT